MIEAAVVSKLLNPGTYLELEVNGNVGLNLIFMVGLRRREPCMQLMGSRRKEPGSPRPARPGQERSCA